MPSHPRRARGKSETKAANDSEPGAGSSRSIWSGSIAFGLVQIPVKMRAGEKQKELAFHQLDKHDKARIKYERTNARTGKPVAWNDIVKGFEISRGQYVVVDDEDFEKANVEATHTIDIQDFVLGSEIPIEYFERPYFLVPEKNGQRAYSILRDALASKSLVAIALVVIRTRQRLCALVPEGDAINLVLMRFSEEIVPVSSIEKELPKKAKATPQETKLAEQLIDTLTAKWDPEKYKDTYSRDLLAAIHEKAETGTITPAGETSRATSHAKVVDLLALLKESVARSSNTSSKKSASEKPSVKATHARKSRKTEKESAA